jgi:hypothetical protein
VTAAVLGGNLIISGTAEGDVAVIGSATAGEFTVTEDGNEVGKLSGVSKDIRISLASNAVGNNVEIDLGAQSVYRVRVNFADGDNTLSLSNGTTRGGVYVRSGDGDDTVVLNADLDVAGDVDLRLGDGVNAVELAGHVGRNVKVIGGEGDDTLTLTETAQIDRGLSAWLGNGDNTVTVQGAIGRDVFIHLGDGDDLVDIGVDAVLGRSLTTNLGSGDNTVNVAGAIAKHMSINALDGNDTIAFSEDSDISGSAKIILGDGDNAAQFDGTVGGNLKVTSKNIDDVFTIGETGFVTGNESLTPGEQEGLRRGHGGRWGFAWPRLSFDFQTSLNAPSIDKLRTLAYNSANSVLGKIVDLQAVSPYDTGTESTGGCRFGQGIVSIKPAKAR